ncbi:MAG: putative bifunctional diguanylate cyclase/phosphodiesterase [Bryobacteraceae bacterium]
MCRAKRNGKNEAEFFFGRQHSDDRLALEMEGALRTAVENNELQVLYQPVVRMDGRIDGMEALLVWNHPRMGKITPHRFIPIAEETGLIVPIGAWVIDQVCRQNARWQESGLPPVKISVNVSTLQFGRTDFVETVRKALADSALQARYLELELTESILLRDVEQSLRRMSRLRELGVSMAIDDFGTGYSSLNYLWRLPLDTLKIDRSFLPDLALPGGSMPVVETILSLAHSVGLRVIAEGVETTEQLELLRAAGCDRVQGHLFGYALPTEQIEKMLAANEPLIPKEL